MTQTRWLVRQHASVRVFEHHATVTDQDDVLSGFFSVGYLNRVSREIAVYLGNIIGADNDKWCGVTNVGTFQLLSTNAAYKLKSKLYPNPSS